MGTNKWDAQVIKPWHQIISLNSQGSMSQDTGNIRFVNLSSFLRVYSSPYYSFMIDVISILWLNCMVPIPTALRFSFGIYDE